MIFLFYVDISRPDHPLSSIFVYTTVYVMNDSKLSCPKCTNLQNLFLIQSSTSQLMPSPSTQASKQGRKLKILLFSHHLSSDTLVFQQVLVYLSKIYLKPTSFSPLISGDHSSLSPEQLLCTSPCLYTCPPNLFYP